MSKKQKTRTVILVLLLTVAIIAGVFGISYYKNGYVAPWVEQKTEESAPVEEKVAEVKEEKKEEPKKEEPKKEEKKEEEPVEEEPEVVEEEKPLLENFGYVGALSVKDASLVDKDGKKVQLGGVSSYNLSWNPEYITKESIASLKNTFGINVIRLAVYTSDYNGYCIAGSEVQEGVKTTIDEAVKAATENDMYVIIDWNNYNDYDPNEYKPQAIQFFGEMVRKYKNNDNVIYEICNAPLKKCSWGDVIVYADELIPVIRNVDKDALILVGAGNSTEAFTEIAEAPIEFDNVMYSLHYDANTDKSSKRDALVKAVEEKLPVFVSDFALSEDVESKLWFELFDDYNLSCVVWNLSNVEDTSAVLAKDCTKLTDWTTDDLSARGQFLYEYFSKESNTNDN